MIRRFSYGLLLVFVLLSACTPPSSEPVAKITQTTGPEPVTTASPELATVPEALKYIFETPADPVSISATLDTGRKAETVITAQGGSLSASAADGTTFRLDVPAGALASDTLIRMTPVSALEGMPFGSEAYAVQFEPEGLQLYDFATLTITPAQPLPVDQQIFFGYSGLGDDLVLAPPVVDSSEIKIQILHFSGYGVTKGFLADIEPVRARIAGDAERRLQSAIAEQLTKARQAALMGQEDAGSDIDWGGFFQQWEEQVVKPRIAAAGESCAAGRLAIQTVLSYERQRQLLGMGESNMESLLTANNLVDTVAEVCMKEEYEMCRDDHTIHRIIPAWLGLERQNALLGGAAVSAAEMVKVKDYVKRCLTFEVQFHSEANLTPGSPDGFTSIVDSKIKIQFDPDSMDMRGEAPLVNTEFEFRVGGCSVASNRGGDTFTAMSLKFSPDTKSPTDALGYVRDFTLIYFPGNTSESFTVTCSDAPAYPSPASPLWTGTFLLLHQDEMSMSLGGLVADEWEIFGNEYFAKKEWIREDAGEGITEAGTFKLYHKPE